MIKMKLFIKKVLWYFETIRLGVEYAQRIKEYKFLLSTLNTLELALLEMKRKEFSEVKISKIEGQVELIKKILLFVSK